MAVAIQASTKVSWSSGDGTLTKPTGTVDGDLIIIAVGGDMGASEDHTYSITGFSTLLADTRSHASNAGVDLQVFYKIASSEGASWTIDIDSDNLSGAIALRIDGFDSADPFDATQITGYDDSTEGKVPAITTTLDNCLIVGICSWDQSKTQTAIPTGWSEQEHVDVSGYDISAIYKTLASAGDTGVGQYDLSSASPHVGATFAINIATGGVTIRRYTLPLIGVG